MEYGTGETFRVFTRTGWKRNPSWPDEREPGVGRKTTIARHCTEEEARRIARKYNVTHSRGFLNRKAEFEQE